MPIQKKLLDKVLPLLQALIATPSFSRQEAATASIIADFLQAEGIQWKRQHNNIWAVNSYYEEGKPTILLNSHHDTVRPVESWTRDPFSATIENGQLFGLGSNDAGASLVALIACFLHYSSQENLPFNLLLAATAEEEISGNNGIAALLPELGLIDLGIVGEPTQLRMAIAEKGLMVIDGIAKGKAGHAARDEGINALYIAFNDIARLRATRFDRNSQLLGPTRLQVTQIQSGTQHNVIPDECSFVIDVRSNEHYSNETIFELLQQMTQSTLTARSFRLNSSSIESDHSIVCKGRKMGLSTFGSPTLSDQALMPFRTLKIGCGHSARSHTANEYIHLTEIAEGIDTYIRLLDGLQPTYHQSSTNLAYENLAKSNTAQ